MKIDPETRASLRATGMTDGDITLIGDMASHANTEALSAVSMVIDRVPEHLRLYCAVVSMKLISDSTDKALKALLVRTAQQIMDEL